MLLFNDTLSSSQVKGRRFVCAPGVPFHKEVLSILAAEFVPGDGFRLNKALIANPSEPMLLNNKAFCLIECGRLREASEVLRRARSIKKGWIPTYR
jgi:hypothetical protein